MCLSPRAQSPDTRHLKQQYPHQEKKHDLSLQVLATMVHKLRFQMRPHIPTIMRGIAAKLAAPGADFSLVLASIVVAAYCIDFDMQVSVNALHGYLTPGATSHRMYILIRTDTDPFSNLDSCCLTDRRILHCAHVPTGPLNHPM